MVRVDDDGQGRPEGLAIDPSLLTPADKEMVEDLIVAAFADAKAKAERVGGREDAGADRGPAPAARHEAAVLGPPMASTVAGPEIERLIQLLARLPGLGPRSARRAALHLIRKRETLMQPLAEAMRVADERIVACSTCGNIDTRDPCTICADPGRDAATIVVVESVGDLWALERAGAIRARYHVLGGVLSPLDGVGPGRSGHPAARRARRRRRGRARSSSPSTRPSTARRPPTTSPTVSPTIAVKVTRLAHGVPVGGELDYLDDGTIAAAMRQRTAF